VVVVVESGVGCEVIVVRCGEGLTGEGGRGTVEGDSEDECDDFHDEDDNDDDDGNDDSGNDDDVGNDARDSEWTASNDDENPSFTLKVYEEEEQEEEYVLTLEKEKSDDEEKMYEEEDDDVEKELYRDLNITQGLKDANMTNVKQGEADQKNASHESRFVHEEEDAHVTLTTVHDTTEEEVNMAVRLQSNKLREETQAENQEFLNQVDSTMKAIIKERVKAQVSKIMPQIEKYVTESLGAEVLKPDKPLTSDRAWDKSKSIDFRPPQKWISTIAKARQPPRTFDELMGTPIDFLAYVMNRLKFDNLTQ
nr:hypothetical protein [Tanacetum cinerariifolium]